MAGAWVMEKLQHQPEHPGVAHVGSGGGTSLVGMLGKEQRGEKTGIEME